MILFFLRVEGKAAEDWSNITGECRLGERIIIKKGTKIRMYTREDGKIVLEETVLKRDRKASLLKCEFGVYALLEDCGNLIVISEKPAREIVIKREPIYITPPPPTVVYYPPPIYYYPAPPVYWQYPNIFLFFHYERHRYHHHFPISPRPPTVTTLPPVVH